MGGFSTIQLCHVGLHIHGGGDGISTNSNVISSNASVWSSQADASVLFAFFSLSIWSKAFVSFFPHVPSDGRNLTAKPGSSKSLIGRVAANV